MLEILARYRHLWVGIDVHGETEAFGPYSCRIETRRGRIIPFKLECSPYTAEC